MSFAFRYNEKVKVIHGFYVGNKGVIVDWRNREVTRNLRRCVGLKGWLRMKPIWEDTPECIGVERLYKVRIDGKDYGDSLVWILGQHLEKA